MQSLVSKMAMQAAIAGGLSMGTKFLKKFYSQEHCQEVENTLFLKSNTSLCEALNGISKLQLNEFQDIVYEIESILRETFSSKNPETPWIVNRKMHNTIRYLKMRAECCKTSKNDDVIVAYLDCQSDHIPQIEAQFEMMIHNLLLDRSTS